MSNEREQTGDGSLGLQYLGFWSRTQGSELLPAPLLQAAGSITQQAGWMATLPTTVDPASITDVRTWIETDPTAQAIIKDSILRKENEGWLRGQIRDAEHSAAAAAVVAWLNTAGISDPQIGLDASIDEVMKQLDGLSGREKLAEASAGYRAIATSEADGWRWLTILTKKKGIKLDHDTRTTTR
jgi:hypothetical protein